MPACQGRYGSVHQWWDIGLEALGDPSHQAPRIQKMLRPEMTLRPPVAGFELDSQKVPDFAKNTILNHAQQFSVGVAHPQRRSLRNRPVDLQARARKRNILQIGDTTPRTTALVLPLHVHEVRTQHPRFYAPIEHVYR